MEYPRTSSPHRGEDSDSQWYNDIEYGQRLSFNESEDSPKKSPDSASHSKSEEEASPRMSPDSSSHFVDDKDEYIKELESTIGHLKWHCEVYRQSLVRLPQGLAVFKDTLKDYAAREEQLCSQCMLDNLECKLKDCQEKLSQFTNEERSSSPILGSGMKRRNLCCNSTTE